MSPNESYGYWSHPARYLGRRVIRFRRLEKRRASGSATKKQLPCSHRNLYHGRVELPLLFVWDGELLPRLVLFCYLCPDPV